MSGIQIPIPFGSGVGYGLVVGLGFLFAFGMTAISWFLAKYNSERQTSGD
jgi:hypothetical protein